MDAAIGDVLHAHPDLMATSFAELRPGCRRDGRPRSRGPHRSGDRRSRLPRIPHRLREHDPLIGPQVQRRRQAAPVDEAVAGSAGPVVVAGSLYLVGAARALLVDDPDLRDPA
jgi:hypothetical protein